MNLEEKIELVKNIYNNLEIKDYNLESKRDEEIKADFIWISNQRGPGGIIVSDDGSYLFCQSAHGYDYWRDEFIKGTRSNN